MDRISKSIATLLLCFGLLTGAVFGAQIEPTWESMAANYQVEMTRALTEFHTQRYGHQSEFGYEDLVPLFKAENWDPEGLVKFFKTNGAHFIMPVACHHDNFDMYDSFHPWNAVDMGPKRDTLKEWKEAAHKHGLKFGVSTHLYWSPRFFNSARQYQKEGTLPENQAAYIKAIGDFVKVNGEGIYGTRPWKVYGEGPLKMRDGRQGENHKDFSPQDIRFTTKDGVLYAFVLAPPTEDIVIKTLGDNYPAYYVYIEKL